MISDNFYITAPIFYVNDVPHIGHAYTCIACDVMSRFMRLADKNVKYLSGTDEHGQKVQKSAQKAGISPQEFVDKTSDVFRKMMRSLNISNDDFIRTTENRHRKATCAFWKQLEASGDIYLGKYSGWYSVRDEAYYSEQELTKNGLAPTGAPVEWIEEPSYFFALSKWQGKLLEHYEKNQNFIWPESRRNEVISFVKGGLNDLSISRTSFKWGIPVPGDSDHVLYVWLDALTNYIAALGYPDEQGDFKKFWPAFAHVIGKDILKFHAVYWPAFLMVAGIELPKTIIAHGWWTNEGQKISKSVGNVINPFKLVDEFGVDQVRYFLMREISFGNDGNFSKKKLLMRNNSELANKIGNLLQRTNSFVYKYCQQQVPVIRATFINKVYNTPLFKKLSFIVNDNIIQMESFHINKVLDNIIHITERANIYIDHEAPWTLRKSNPKKMQEILYTLLESLRYISIMLQPFIPNSASKMLNQLNVPENQRSFSHLSKEFAIKSGQELVEPTPIFFRLDK